MDIQCFGRTDKHIVVYYMQVSVPISPATIMFPAVVLLRCRIGDVVANWVQVMFTVSREM